MKKTLLLLFLSAILSNSKGQAKIYIAQNGSDRNDGSLRRPFKTMEAALASVASSRNAAVEICLRGGRYELAKTIQIAPGLLNGHSLTLRNYKNERVVLTGSVKLTPHWKSYKGKILQSFIGKGLSIDQLLCNGKLLYMARYPNFDSSARVFNGTAADAISKEHVKKWADPRGGYVHALHRSEWGALHYLIKGKSGDSLLMEGGWQTNRPAPMHAQYRFVENIFEELDAPGEWYYNSSSGMLYLYPPEHTDITTALLEGSVLDNIIEIKGSEGNPVQKVMVRGIVFTATNRTFMQKKEPLLRSDWTICRGGAILIEGARDVEVRNCVFTALGGNGIFISGFDRNINVEHNYIHHIGGTAIAFVGDTASVRSPSFRYNQFVPIEKMDKTPGPRTDLYPAHCKAYDNLIHHIGTIEKQVAGVEIDIAEDITVSHNTIYHVPRAGINIGDGCFGGHVIEFNDVFNTVLETGDHGAFNSWGRDRFWLPGIRDVDQLVDRYPELPLLDVTKPVTLRNNRFSCKHGWDIDLDDGSSHYRIYNNLCLNGGLKLREGFYRDVENNIIVNNTFHPHVWYARSMDVFAHNIVTLPYAPIRVRNWGRMVDSNFFIQPGALDSARKNSTDVHSLQGDPLFANEKEGDFRVRTGSNALLVGFKNFPMKGFGVISPFLKQKAMKPKIAAVPSLQVIKTSASAEWIGATIKNIETLGEQSVAGLADKNGVLIVRIASDSKIKQSGMEPGDVILAVNEKPVASVEEFLREMQTIRPQDRTVFTVFHHQQLQKLTLQWK